MADATVREFRADPTGTKRLMAAIGDTAPDVNAVAPAPTAPTMGAQNYSPTPDVDVVSASVPPIATAGNDATHTLGEVSREGTVTSATLIPDTAITGAATNHRRVRIINKGQAGTGTTIVAELIFINGVNAAVTDEKALTLSGTPANLDVVAGDVLAYESTHIGTGITDPGGVVQVEINPEFD
jgi:hypothetical protein